MGNQNTKIRDLIPETYPFEQFFTVIQNADVFMEVAMVYLEKAFQLWGKRSMALIVLGLPPYVVTNDVANITYILKTNFENFPKGPEMKLRFQELLGNGIFNADDEQWMFHRKTSANLFNLNRFKGAILDTFNEHCDIVLHILNQTRGAAFDFQRLMHQFTLDSIGKIAFGEELKSLESQVNFADDFDYCQAFANDSFINPLWRIKRYCTPAGWLYFWRLWRLNRFVYKMVAQRRSEIAAGHTRNDLVSMYLDRQDAADRQLTDEDLRDIVLNFLIAGRDTTAQALSWAFYRLCLNPDCQERARQEVLSTIGTQSAEHLPFEVLQDMKYLDAVCFETLRLHPSVPKEAKYVRNDDTLPDGTKVYKGDTVIFLPWVMGRSEELWENAHCFNPDRFYGATTKPSSFVFTAFQAGPRICLGQNLALLEMKCCMARLLSKFSFKLEQDPTSVTYLNSLTLPIKGGVKMSVLPLK